jgi:hypothetical protein
MIFEAEVPQDTLRSLEIESDAHVTLQNDDSNKVKNLFFIFHITVLISKFFPV